MPSIVPWTPEHFERALEVTADVMPTLAGVELVDVYNGMFSFTPDAFPVMGESPDVKGFWSAQAVWITPRRRGRQDHGRVDGHRLPVHGHAGVGHRAVPPSRLGAAVRPGKGGAAVPRGLRHQAPATADEQPARPPRHAVPRQAGGAWRGLLRERWLGAPAVVRGQRCAGHARFPGPLRMGGPRVVADRRGRAPGGQRERGRIRLDALRQDRGVGPRCAGVPPAHHVQSDGQAPWAERHIPPC